MDRHVLVYRGTYLDWCVSPSLSNVAEVYSLAMLHYSGMAGPEMFDCSVFSPQTPPPPQPPSSLPPSLPPSLSFSGCELYYWSCGVSVSIAVFLPPPQGLISIPSHGWGPNEAPPPLPAHSHDNQLPHRATIGWASPVPLPIITPPTSPVSEPDLRMTSLERH